MKEIGNIFVIIPVHNRRDFTKQCLRSLRDQTYAQFATILVDDGSTDGTDEMVRSEFPEVQLIKGNGNLWWTGGINLGIQSALREGASYVLTMNNDTVVHSDFMERMVEWAQIYPEALLGAVDKEADSGKILYAGTNEIWFFDKQIHHANRLKKKEKINGLTEISTYHGRGLWIPTEVFEVNGLFDQERFPHYMADIDFSYNAYKKGFKVFCNLDAPVYSFPEESGEYQIRTHKSFTNFLKHLFDIKGGGNLKDFMSYTFKNAPTIQIIPKLFFGLSKRIFGYWLY